jgi:hypothetical protein
VSNLSAIIAHEVEHLSFACQLLEHGPRLLPGPWQTLGVVDVLSKGLLPQFSDAASDDVLYRFFDALTTADFVD